MGCKTDYLKKLYTPMMHKTLRSALIHLLGEQFPRCMGGQRLRGACADMILEVVFRHLVAREHLCHGQVIWIAIDKDDPPGRAKTMAQTRLRPVVLDLSCPGDLQRRIERVPAGERLRQKAIRLCRQAYEQGGLLSNCDLAELLAANQTYISELLVEYERQRDQVVPRRATVHDVGTGLTHKRIICWKRYAEGKSSDVIAQQTYHSMEAVDRYLGQFDRVRHCRKHGLSPQQTAFSLGCSLALVQEYLDIDRELENLHG